MGHIIGAPGAFGVAIAAGLLLALPAMSAAQTGQDGRPPAGDRTARAIPALASVGRDTSRFAGWSAGAVERGDGMRSVRGSRRVREVQRRLRAAGFSPGPVDGRFGPRTEQAVLAFQQVFGLLRDGVVGRQTLHALRLGGLRATARPGTTTPAAARRVERLQRRLRRLGHDPGRADGRFGARTRAAVVRFQAAHGLSADGIVGPRTLAAMRRVDASESAPKLQAARQRTAKAEDKRATSRAGGAAETGPVPTEPSTPPSRAAVPTDGAWPLVLWMALAACVLLVPLLLTGALRARRRSRDRSSAPASDTGTGAREPRRDAASRPAAHAPRAVGYALLPTADTRIHFQAQIQGIERACADRGLTLQRVCQDVAGPVGRDRRRPGLQAALDQIAEGQAAVLVVCTLRSLGRSAVEIGDLLATLRRCDASLVVSDLELDTATPEGRLAARALYAAGQVEQERSWSPSRSGAAAIPAGSVRNGRPPAQSRAELHARIVAMRARGMTLRAIVDELTAEGPPPLGGGQRFRPSGRREPRARVRNER